MVPQSSQSPNLEMWNYGLCPLLYFPHPVNHHIVLTSTSLIYLKCFISLLLLPTTISFWQDCFNSLLTFPASSLFLPQISLPCNCKNAKGAHINRNLTMALPCWKSFSGKDVTCDALPDLPASLSSQTSCCCLPSTFCFSSDECLVYVSPPLSPITTLICWLMSSHPSDSTQVSPACQ